MPHNPSSPPFDAPGDVPLSGLAPGSHAEIVALDTSSPEGRRLGDLGFLPGTEIEVIRRAPLGDPISFRLRGSDLCLRAGDAARIRVRLRVEPRA